jgi:hypothetical protein
VRVILLGPQRRPTLDAVARYHALGASGPVATVTAGWREREPDDAELKRLLGGRAVNLGLYRRWLDVQERDPGYAAGERRLAETLAELQDLYLVRLDYALRAVYALRRRSALGAGALGAGALGAGALGAGALGAGALGAGAEALSEAMTAVRELDAAHLRRVNGARLEFFQRLAPHDRPVIAGHRAAVSALLAEASGVVIAGGHVGVLAEVLHLFNVAAALRPPVVAWSAGAMALTDRIVLFHDRAPQGPGYPEAYGSGLSVVRDAVLLPHARARLLLDDAPRMAVFARRFGPARCILLESGTRIEIDGPGWPPGVRVIGEDGHVRLLETALEAS